MKKRTVNVLMQDPNHLISPRCAANAHFYPTLTEHEKGRVFAAVRTCATERANAAQYRKLLAERAQLIPTFHLFKMLVLEDLRTAYSEDRLNRTRAAKNRRLSWMALFKPFAALRGIDKALVIQALDRSGNYQCELTDKTQPDMWERFVRLGADYGIEEEELDTLSRRAQERGKKRA